MYPFKKALEFQTRFPTSYTRIAAFDFETTGLNLRHTDAPFMLSFTYNDGVQELFEAEVDPFTRTPIWTNEQRKEIHSRFNHPDWLYVGSNTKYDVLCATIVCPDLDPVELLKRCHDTIQEHHGVNNAEDHKLKSAAVKHAGIPDDDERQLKLGVTQARKIAASLGWKIANKENCPMQRRAPSKKEGGWAVMDMWVPKAVAKWQWEHSQAYRFLCDTQCDHEHSIAAVYSRLTQQQRHQVHHKDGWEWHPPEIAPNAHKWWTLCSTYCNRDTFRSLVLHNTFTASLVEDKLLPNYIENRTSLSVSFATEQRGITINLNTAKELIKKFKVDRRNAELALRGSLNVVGFNPASPKQVYNIIYGYFGIPITRYTKNSIAANRRDSSKKLNPTTDGDFIASLVTQFKADLEADGDSLEDIAPPLYYEGVEPYKDYQTRVRAWYKTLVEKEKPSTRQIVAFCCALLMFKKANTSIKYLESYIHSAKPHPKNEEFSLAAAVHAIGSDNGLHFKGTPEQVLEAYEASWASSSEEELLDNEKNAIRQQLTDLLASRCCYGTLYPSLNPVGTKTLRYSSSNPNGQNISKGGKGKKGLEWLFKTNHSLRSVFGPTPDREWWAVDYHQIQLVVFAILCGDEAMVQAVHNGEDFHTFVACKVFNYSKEEWKVLPSAEKDKPASYNGHSKEYCRDIAKTINFAFVFGAQEDKLNRTSGIPGCYNILRNVFPRAIDFLESVEWEVRRNGYVYTPGGYRLYIPETTPYAGVNYIVQGAEGEIVKRAQYGIQTYMERYVENPSDFFMTLYIHDELLFDSIRNQGYRHIGNVISIMNDAALSYGFPSKASPKYIIDDWANGKKVQVA